MVCENKACEYVNLLNDKFSVHSPELTFYVDRKWSMRFADADFPVIECGLGILIDFDKNNNTESFSILSDEDYF